MKPGWTEAAFVEVCRDVSSLGGKVPKTEWHSAGALPIIDQGDSDVAGYTDDRSAEFRGGLPVIVFGDHTRRFKFVDHPFAVGADGVKVLAPTASIDGRFLYWFLKSVEIPSAGYSRHFKFLREVRVPVPPLHEQRRLAGLLGMAETLWVRCREPMTMTQQLVEAIFARTFGSRDRAPDAARERIGEIADVVTGNTPPRAVAANYGDFIGWVKNDNVRSDQAYVTTPEEGLSAIGAASGRIVDGGAVLVTCISGSPAQIGRVALTQERVAFNQQINAIVGERFDPRFLCTRLRMDSARLRRLSSGGMKGMISKSALQSFEVALPSLDEQRAFGEVFDTAEAVRRSFARRRAEADTLVTTLQHRAFTGAL